MMAKQIGCVLDEGHDGDCYVGTKRFDCDYAQLYAEINALRAENALLREALPSDDEWLDGESALSVYEETTQKGRWPAWNWALRVRSVLSRLPAPTLKEGA